MKELPDESVHHIVTSPPYWQLKDYGHKGQIGYNDTYEDYINNLNLVWSECYRVLHKGCRLCINIGDQFARSVYYGRYKIIPIRTEIIKFCETIGFDYMGAIIWQKVTTCNTTGGATVMGSFPYPRSGILKIDYEFILIFKKLGNPPKVSKKMKDESKLSQREWNEYFSGHWNFSGEKQNRHLAMFPEELPRRLIKMFSFVGDTVLDPFLGSGTTTLAAKNLKRNSIGYEINEEFLPIIKKKVGVDKFTIFDDTEFQIVKQEKSKTDFTDEIKRLPYLFKDPLKFDKKIDPRQLRFGSRVDNSAYNEESGYKITEIVSPEVLMLEDGLKVKLIGVKEKKELNGEATKFLQERLKGKRIFMKFDNAKYDNEGNLLCYLYLHNKTFINAHLIKSGFVDVDTSFDYKYKSKFLDLEAQVN